MEKDGFEFSFLLHWSYQSTITENLKKFTHPDTSFYVRSQKINIRYDGIDPVYIEYYAG